MTKRSSVLLVAVLAMVSLLAACADRVDSGHLMGHDDNGVAQGSAATTTTGAKSTVTPTGPTETVDGQDPNNVGPLPTNVTAKAYFTQNVQPALSSGCGGCHSSGPGPSWIVPSDAEKSYTLVFGRGYIIRDSILLKKGAHNGGTAPALTAAQYKTVATWIELEMKERGDKAPPSVLAKMGDCMDRAKFDAIGWEKIETITRTPDNNPNGETEDADTCTGCKPTTCAVCHSADAATGFVMAEGNPIFDKDYTFNQTKKTSPAYLQKYFGLDTNGDPKASQGIRMKSDNTYYTAKAYQHPMFRLTADQEQAIDDFVADAIAKYKAGACGK
jgi:mono/diheme cytochrome c family protein